MSNRLIAARRAAFFEQEGKCFYCKVEMHELTIENSQEAAQRLLGASTQTAGVKYQLRKIRCTAEHIVKKADGGSDQDENIVAACMHCNTTRGDTSVEDFLLIKGNVNVEETRTLELVPIHVASNEQTS